MRLVYLGTPAMAVPPLRALVGAGYDVALVVSRPDARRGRGAERTPSPVKAAATALGLSVTDRVEDVVELDPRADLGVVVAFGRIIRPPVLEAVPMVNLHFSLLPRWRGAAPVERAILAGDRVTGVAVMGVEEGLDTGPVYAETETDIGPDETADELRDRLVTLGTAALLDVLGEGLATVDPWAQEGEATYARKVDPAELRLDWDGDADALHRLVRVGGAWTTVRGRRLKVHRSHLAGDRGLAPGTVAGTDVGTGSGTLRLVEVQPEDRPRQPAEAWANGARLAAGDRLGT